MTVDEAISTLTQKAKSTRCSELTGILRSLGFNVRDGKKGGHKVISHPGLLNFLGSGFDAGHGSDREVKPPYIRNMIRMLKTHKQELGEWLENQR